MNHMLRVSSSYIGENMMADSYFECERDKFEARLYYYIKVIQTHRID